MFPGRARYSICCCLYQLRKEFAVQKLGQPPSLEQNKLCFYPHTATCLSQAFCSTSVLRHRISLTWDYLQISFGWAPLIPTSFFAWTYWQQFSAPPVSFHWKAVQITPAMSQPTLNSAHSIQNSPSRLWIPCFWVSAFIRQADLVLPGKKCYKMQAGLHCSTTGTFGAAANPASLSFSPAAQWGHRVQANQALPCSLPGQSSLGDSRQMESQAFLYSAALFLTWKSWKLFFFSFALSASFYEPEVCQASTPASTTSAKWIFGYENHCSLPQHGDFILCRVEKSRAGVTPDVLSLSFFPA